MSLWMVLLGTLLGCGSSTPEPASTEAPAAARGKAKRKFAKNKRRRMKGKRKGKAQRQAPIGAAGEVLGELVLTKMEEPVRKPQAAPAKPATPEAQAAPAEAADGVEAEGTEMVTRTKAELKLRWGADGTDTVSLGKVRGTCTEGDTKPIGPAGKEKTPLWTVRCDDGSKEIELFILQIGPKISVVREVPGTTPEAQATFKPVKRIPLVQG
ncbi:MAG: hypothetical protein AAF211_15860, partial [Myxococcota bacterium]